MPGELFRDGVKIGDVDGNLRLQEVETELGFWRAAVAGRAGFNGQPQALLRLMEVSDRSKLEKLRLAFPEAVQAFEEARVARGDRMSIGRPPGDPR